MTWETQIGGFRGNRLFLHDKLNGVKYEIEMYAAGGLGLRINPTCGEWNMMVVPHSTSECSISALSASLEPRHANSRAEYRNMHIQDAAKG